MCVGKTQIARSKAFALSRPGDRSSKYITFLAKGSPGAHVNTMGTTTSRSTRSYRRFEWCKKEFYGVRSGSENHRSAIKIEKIARLALILSVSAMVHSDIDCCACRCVDFATRPNARPIPVSLDTKPAQDHGPAPTNPLFGCVVAEGGQDTQDAG